MPGFDLLIRVDRDVDPDRWDAWATDNGGAVFQSYGWAMYRGLMADGTPLFVRWVDSRTGRCLFAAVGLRRPQYGSWRGRLGARIDFDGPPIGCASPPDDLIAGLTRWAKAESAVLEIGLGSFGGGVACWGIGVPRADERTEFIVQTGAPQAMLGRMRKGCRASIKKAERLGLSVRRSESIVDLRIFERLYGETLIRLRTTKGVNIGTVRHGRLASSLAALAARQNARLYIASMDGVPIAGCLFAVFGDKAYYLLNGASSTALDTGATPLTLFRALTDLSSAGYGPINLGGVSKGAASPDSSSHGLYAFKMGLGSQPHECISSSLTIRPVRRTLMTAERESRRILSSLAVRLCP